MSILILGPTGEYPEGKLGPEDDGELQIAIGATEGKVKIVFGTSVWMLAKGPKQARGMAASLIHMAEQIERGNA